MPQNTETMRPQRYGPSNPPPDRLAAKQRIVALESDGERIDRQLEETAADSFADRAQYTSWRARASAAFKYTGEELFFLQTWLAAANKPEGQNLKRIPAEEKKPLSRKSEILVLLEVIDRAVSEGFVLSGEEQRAIARIRLSLSPYATADVG